jgi:REP element-mobilizing transposase RayT
LGGTEDHVHLLVSLARDVSIATLIKDVKGSSAHFVTRHLKANPTFRWQRGYGAFSIRKTDIPTVRHYILHQKQHHRTNAITSDWEPRGDDQTPGMIT